MVVCNICGGDDVESKSWTRPNDNDSYVESCDEDEGYCNECANSHLLIEKSDWDSDNRCSECSEINNSNVNNCECTICNVCDKNQDNGDCECSFCTHCSENENADLCECSICDECNGNIDAKECECESKANEESAPSVISEGSSINNDIKNIIKEMEPLEKANKDNNSMVTWKCLDCNHKFEALPTMSMCDTCLSDNIKKE